MSWYCPLLISAPSCHIEPYLSYEPFLFRGQSLNRVDAFYSESISCVLFQELLGAHVLNKTQVKLVFSKGSGQEWIVQYFSNRDAGKELLGHFILMQIVIQ